MPRIKRYCPPGIPQHIIQRGNNRQVCFGSDEDYAAYSEFLYEGSVKFGVSIHAWVLMTNHVHLLVTPSHSQSISKMMQYIGRHYVPYINFNYGRTGTLWEGRFKSCLVEQGSYLINCQRYIELNPVRANMVSDPAEYRWSSYSANALGLDSQLHTPHELYMAIGNSKEERLAVYRSLFDNEFQDEAISDIRRAVNQGLVLGSEQFKDEIELLSGEKARLLKRGPKPKAKEWW